MSCWCFHAAAKDWFVSLSFFLLPLPWAAVTLESDSHVGLWSEPCLLDSFFFFFASNLCFIHSVASSRKLATILNSWLSCLASHGLCGEAGHFFPSPCLTYIRSLSRNLLPFGWRPVFVGLLMIRWAPLFCIFVQTCLFFLVFCRFRATLWHMEVPRLGD